MRITACLFDFDGVTVLIAATAGVPSELVPAATS